MWPIYNRPSFFDYIFKTITCFFYILIYFVCLFLSGCGKTAAAVRVTTNRTKKIIKDEYNLYTITQFKDKNDK